MLFLIPHRLPHQYRVNGYYACVLYGAPAKPLIVWPLRSMCMSRKGCTGCVTLQQYRLAAGMFLVHYAWRSFAYPLLSQGGNPTPVFIWLLAVAFCMYNGLLQASARPLMDSFAPP